MDRGRTSRPRLTIACTLTQDELASMRERLLRALGQSDLPRVHRCRFEPQIGLLAQAAAVIDVERRCCRFLRFRLAVERGEGPVWLEVTGPEGTEDFLSSLAIDMPGTSNAT